MNIKSAVWNHPLYRKDFTSMYIYNAVLDGEVDEVDGFIRWLKGTNGLNIQI